MKYATTATYGGDDKADPCENTEDWEVAIYSDAECKTKDEALTEASNVDGQELIKSGSPEWYNMFCTEESYKMVYPQIDTTIEIKWGECT